MFPLNKYTYVVNGNKIIALQTYGGKVYRGVAKCAPEDEFDFEIGQQLAAARCNKKIAQARFAAANQKYNNAFDQCEYWQKQKDKYAHFTNDAAESVRIASDHLFALECNF